MTPLTDGVAVRDNILHFESVHHYANFIDSFQQGAYDAIVNAASFTSLVDVKLSGGQRTDLVDIIDSTDNDVIIFNLINSDGFIKLGDYLIRLDLVDQRAFVSEEYSTIVSLQGPICGVRLCI